MAVDTLEAVVRSLHILSGVVWVGGAVYAGAVVGRTLRDAPVPARKAAMSRIGPAGFRVLAYAGTLTILFGLWNQYLVSGGLRFERNAWEMYMGATLVIAVAMMGIAGGMVMPSLRRMGQLQEGDAAGAAALQKKLATASILNMVLGLLAVVLMVLATLERTRPIA